MAAPSLESLLMPLFLNFLTVINTVEPPNKGHIGDNINSAVVSFVERLSSFGGS